MELNGDMIAAVEILEIVEVIKRRRDSLKNSSN
jgi:hypothetical protein